MWRVLAEPAAACLPTDRGRGQDRDQDQDRNQDRDQDQDQDRALPRQCGQEPRTVPSTPPAPGRPVTQKSQLMWFGTM